MPLNRYQLRNEYSLGDPELYRVVDKDDPEAILEAVAMAGLFGVLRQLGDLAEFAAEIFHDLHEQVVATAEKGHGLTARVQQLEAELPSIEKRLLSQTNHTTPLYNSGIDWHHNPCMDQNLITGVDLPRFVMDSYEECRGPPRLFLLDKFDVGGAGACLTRYTDPSFFKVEASPSEIAKSNGLRERRLRKEKRKGSSWRHGETPESYTASHAKLHQLLLVDRLQNGGNDTERRVKLKKRQLTGSCCDEKARKAFVEKLLKTCCAGHKIVPEVPVNPLSMALVIRDVQESVPEIVEIGTVSPPRESEHAEERISSLLPDIKEVVQSSLTESSEIIDEDSSILSLPNCRSESEKDSFTFSVSMNVKKAALNSDSRSTLSDDEYSSDGIPSEVESYMDALATIDSEIETDSEFRARKHLKLVGESVQESDASGRHEGPKFSLDTQSVESSNRSKSLTTSFEGRDAELAELTINDGSGAAATKNSTRASTTDSVQNPVIVEAKCTSSVQNTPFHSIDMLSSLEENLLVKPQIDQKDLCMLIDANERWKVLGANGSSEGTLFDVPSHASDGVVSGSPQAGSTHGDSAITCKTIADAYEDNSSARSLGEVLQIEASNDVKLTNLGHGSFSSSHSVSSTEDEWAHSSSQLKVVAGSNGELPWNRHIVTTHCSLNAVSPANFTSDDYCMPATEANSEKPPLLDPAYSPRLLEQHVTEITTAGPSTDIIFPDEAACIYPDNPNHMVAIEVAKMEEIKQESTTLSYADKSSSLISSLSEIQDATNLVPKVDDLIPFTEENSENESSVHGSRQQHSSGEMDGDLSPGHKLLEEDAVICEDEHVDEDACRTTEIEAIVSSSSPGHKDINLQVASSHVASTLDYSPRGVVECDTEEYPYNPSVEDNTEGQPLLLDLKKNSSELCQNRVEIDAYLLGSLDLTEEPVEVYMDELGCNTISSVSENEKIWETEISVDPNGIAAHHDQTSELSMDKQVHDTVQVHSPEDDISSSTDVSFAEEPSENNSTTSSSDAIQTLHVLEQQPSKTADDSLSVQHYDPQPGLSEADVEDVQLEVNGSTDSSNINAIEDETVFGNALNVQLPSNDLGSSKSMSPCEDSAFLHLGEAGNPESAHTYSVTNYDRDTNVEDMPHTNTVSPFSSREGGVIPLYSKRLQKRSPTAAGDSPKNDTEIADSTSGGDGELDVLENVNEVANTSVSSDLNPFGGASTDVPNLKRLHSALDSITDDMLHTDILSPSCGVGGVIPFYSKRLHNLSPAAAEDSLGDDLEVADLISDHDEESDVLEDVNQVKEVLEDANQLKESSENTELSAHDGASNGLPNSYLLNEVLDSTVEVDCVQKEIWVAKRDASSNDCEDDFELRSSMEAQLSEDTASTHNPLESKPDIGREIEHQDAEADLEVLHVTEVSSNSSTDTTLIHGPRHIEKEISADTAPSSCDEEAVASSASVAPQDGTLVDKGGASQNLDEGTQPMDPLSRGFPVLSILPYVPEICLDEMPPLPPLPPMQWRLGRPRPASQPSEKPSPRDVHPEIVSQASKPENADYVDPLLVQSTIENAKSQNISDVSGSLVATGTSTGSLRSVDNEDCQYVIRASEIGASHSSSNQSRHDQHVRSVGREDVSGPIDRGKITYEPTVANEQLQHVSSLAVQESTIPSLEVGSFPPMHLEQQLLPGLVAPVEVTASLSNASSVIPASQEGNTNGILKKKLPRPRNPLIDAVVAVDKSKLRKVRERVKSHAEQMVEERDSALNVLQLRKVGERVKSKVEQKAEDREEFTDVLQLRKVGERVKSPVEKNAEEGDTRIDVPQLRKVRERARCPLERNEEKDACPDVPQLRKVGERVKSPLQRHAEEGKAPLDVPQLRKVVERSNSPLEQNAEESNAGLDVPQLRKVAERPKSPVPQEEEERDVLLEQIRNKMFYLKPAAATRPIIHGPKTNLKVVAILEKANNIRQAMAGSDEDDSDGWSES
ncbi:SCAR2-like protein [Drosera capensis]